ncbi:MAG: hypothetical protein ABIJ92_02860 [Candidatus Aenigmatarchaeota archaeon]
MAVKKAQMFIVTMVFLVSLIFAVQQSFFQYTSIDTVSTFDVNDKYLIEDLKDLVNDTMHVSWEDCGEESSNVAALFSYLENHNFRNGYAVDFGNSKNSLDCPSPIPGVNATLDLDIRLRRGVRSETNAFYRLEA